MVYTPRLRRCVNPEWYRLASGVSMLPKVNCSAMGASCLVIGKSLPGARTTLLLDGNQISRWRSQPIIGARQPVVPVRSSARDNHVELIQPWTDDPCERHY